MKKILLMMLLMLISIQLVGCTKGIEIKKTDDTNTIEDDIQNSTKDNNVTNATKDDNSLEKDVEDFLEDRLSLKTDKSFDLNITNTDFKYSGKISEIQNEFIKNQFLNERNDFKGSFDVFYEIATLDNNLKIAIIRISSGVDSELDLIIARKNNTPVIIYETYEWSRSLMTYYKNSIVKSSGSNGAASSSTNILAITSNLEVKNVYDYSFEGIAMYGNEGELVNIPDEEKETLFLDIYTFDKKSYYTLNKYDISTDKSTEITDKNILNKVSTMQILKGATNVSSKKIEELEKNKFNALKIPFSKDFGEEIDVYKNIPNTQKEY